MSCSPEPDKKAPIIDKTKNVEQTEDNTLNTLLEKKAPSAYKAVYESTITGLSQNEIVTWYVKEGKIRYDFKLGDIESRTYYVEQQYTSCMKIGSEWQCNIENGENNRLTLPQDNENIKNLKTAYMLADGTISLADRTGKCVKGKVGDATVRVCISEDGFILLNQLLINNQEVTLKAKDISTDVNDADFTPPATPQEY